MISKFRSAIQKAFNRSEIKEETVSVTASKRMLYLIIGISNEMEGRVWLMDSYLDNDFLIVQNIVDSKVITAVERAEQMGLDVNVCVACKMIEMSDIAFNGQFISIGRK